MNKVIVYVLLMVCSCAVSFAEQSAYVEQEFRTIKSLSPERISALLQGKGLGYAKVAELNGFPGPAHVLELAEELELTTEQKLKTTAIFESMEKAAQSLGKQMIEAEQQLDSLFAKGLVTEELVLKLLQEIGVLEGRLRASHVNTHLAQKAIMTQHQVQMYMKLRGYGEGNHPKHHSSH